jgi:hypothetical protein
MGLVLGFLASGFTPVWQNIQSFPGRMNVIA